MIEAEALYDIRWPFGASVSITMNEDGTFNLNWDEDDASWCVATKGQISSLVDLINELVKDRSRYD